MLQRQTLRQNDPQQQIARNFKRPGRIEMFFHGFKTLRLVKALITDPRIPVYRKVLFTLTIVGMLVILFFPDLLGEAFLSAVLPIVGTITGIPLDAGFDWMAFALVAVNLLRYFPADIVSEHYTDIF